MDSNIFHVNTHLYVFRNTKEAKDINVTENFKAGEFISKYDDVHYFFVSEELVNHLQQLRDEYGEMLRKKYAKFGNHWIEITSGYRSPQYNKRTTGAAEYSYHMAGIAADFKIFYVVDEVKQQVEPVEIYNKLDETFEGGLGLYSNRIHIDVRGYKARWIK